MRQLKFVVNEQKLQIDSDCDFSGIASGTENYLLAYFSFSKDWLGLVKVAEFKKTNKSESIPVSILGNRCKIPNEVLTGSKFYIRIVAKRGPTKILTNQLLVKQEV